MPIVKAIFEFLFGCHHRDLSRVFTIRGRSYKVCMGCGAEFDYSLQTMSFKAAPKAHTPEKAAVHALARERLMMTTPSHLAISLVLALVTACALPVTVRGQSATATEHTRATANIPFQFVTLDTRCPAGSYSVTTVGPTHLLIHSKKERVAAEIFTIPDPEFPLGQVFQRSHHRRIRS